MYVGCGFLFVSCVTTVVGNQRYIRIANLSFWRRKSRTKVITAWFSSRPTKNEEKKVLKVFLWSRRLINPI